MNNKILKMVATIIAVSLFFSCSSQKNQNQNAAPGQQNGPPNQQGGGPNQQGGPPNFTELLSKMDANKDGKLSKDEVQGPLKNDFSKIDKDNDGYITAAEFKNAPAPQRPN